MLTASSVITQRNADIFFCRRNVSAQSCRLCRNASEFDGRFMAARLFCVLAILPAVLMIILCRLNQEHRSESRHTSWILAAFHVPFAATASLRHCHPIHRLQGSSSTMPASISPAQILFNPFIADPVNALHFANMV